MQGRLLTLLPAAILAVGLTWAPKPAEACGGTFCDGGGPAPMPVDQTGEDILFIRDGDQMEVHVRIQYTGGPERFAWMVPLPSIPDVSVGSEPLFVQLGAATIPSWTTIRQFEDPSDQPPPNGGVFVSDDSPSEPEVVYADTVGAFEVVVLQADSAADVLEFFDANDYSFEPAAEPIIQLYIDEGFLITGVKLTTGATVDAIHPLVFRFTSDEPCVPIRLTAVAAEQDMGVRAYFLAQERWVPSNYDHVVLNPAAYDWTNPGLPAYVELLSLAVDEAGGHAFATDYAGPSDTVSTTTIWQPEWSQPAWAELGASEALAALDGLNLLTTIAPQLRSILREYIPPPEDWNSGEDTFWRVYWLHPELIDTPAWDAAGFAADFDERIVEPGMHAVDMLEAWPKLTRLHTTLSPYEMTLDPIFHAAPDLPDVTHIRTALAYVFRGFEWTRYLLPFEVDPDGMSASEARVCVAEDGGWPGFPGLHDMPRTLRIEQATMAGPMHVLVDNEAEILALLTAHNEGSPCEDETPGGDGDDDPSGEASDDDAALTDEAGGCRVAPVGAGGLLGFGLGLLGLARRRSRLRSASM